MKKLLLPLIGLSLVASSQAAVIANYDFAGESLTSSDSETNSVAGSLSDIGSNPTTNRDILGSVSASVGNPSPGIDGEFQTFGGGGAPVGTLTESLTENIWIEFTITPDSGFTIDYTDFTIDVEKEAGSAAFYGWLLVDQDSDGWDTGDQIGLEDSFTTIGSWETMSFDASSLSGISTATDFRIYLGSDGTGAANGINVDNLVMNGSVAAVPEPSAFALLAGCFGLTWVMLRRRS